MPTVHRSASQSTPSYRERIDASAESEGAAVETLYDYMDEPAPETQRQAMLGQSRTAEALGIEQERVPHYCRYAAVMAWLRICDGKPYQIKLSWDNDLDRLRRAARRIRRARRLGKLKRAANRTVSLSEAAKLVDLSERVLQRHCSTGRLPAQRLTGNPGRPAFVVRVADLRNLLANKLGKSIAA